MQSRIGFSSATAARLAGITYRQLDHWTRVNVVVPSIEPAAGYGSKRRWNFVDIVGLRVLRELLGEGLSMQRVRCILPVLRSFTGESHNLRALAQARLVVLPAGEVAVLADRNTLIELFPNSGQAVISSIVVELRPALIEVQRAMKTEKLANEVNALKAAGAWILEDAA